VRSLALLVALAAAPAAAQHEHHHGQEAPKPKAEEFVGPVEGGARPASPHSGLFGDYHMTRDASGTSWQPEGVSMEGTHLTRGSWRLMAHGWANLVHTSANGPRGASGFYSTNMMMGEARRDSGTRTVAFRFMGTLEPLMGPRGYPLLLQSGESADGRTLLLDRQHPHDLFMELSALFADRQDDEHPTLFLYTGLPGEPALGPPAFMHRASGVDNPEAPISHHWQDSTHITYGVLTAGMAFDELKFEVSRFRGREPDWRHWDIEAPKLDSTSGRVSWNPSPRWAFQASAGHLRAPDALSPNVDTRRYTASAMSSLRVAGGNLATTVVYGHNDDRPGTSKSSLLAESAWRGGLNTFFGRYELVQKDELLLSLGPNDPLVRVFYPNGFGTAHLPTDPSSPQAVSTPRTPIFTVGKLTFGGIRDLAGGGPWRLGLGLMGSVHMIPSSLRSAYGSNPYSAQVFLRAAWRGKRA
jgi:hypothetical protein